MSQVEIIVLILFFLWAVTGLAFASLSERFVRAIKYFAVIAGLGIVLTLNSAIPFTQTATASDSTVIAQVHPPYWMQGDWQVRPLQSDTATGRMIITESQIITSTVDGSDQSGIEESGVSEMVLAAPAEKKYEYIVHWGDSNGHTRFVWFGSSERLLEWYTGVILQNRFILTPTKPIIQPGVKGIEWSKPNL